MRRSGTRLFRRAIFGVISGIAAAGCAGLIDLTPPQAGLDEAGIASDGQATTLPGDDDAGSDSAPPLPLPELTDAQATLRTFLDTQFGSDARVAQAGITAIEAFRPGLVFVLADEPSAVIHRLDTKGVDAGSVNLTPIDAGDLQETPTRLGTLITGTLGIAGGGSGGSAPSKPIVWFRSLDEAEVLADFATGNVYVAKLLPTADPTAPVDFTLGLTTGSQPFLLESKMQADIVQPPYGSGGAQGTLAPIGIAVLPSEDSHAAQQLLVLGQRSDAGLAFDLLETDDGGRPSFTTSSPPSDSLQSLTSIAFAHSDAGATLVGVTTDDALTIGTANAQGAAMNAVARENNVSVTTASTNGAITVAGGCVTLAGTTKHPWIARFRGSALDPAFGINGVVEATDFDDYCVKAARFDNGGGLYVLLTPDSGSQLPALIVRLLPIAGE